MNKKKLFIAAIASLLILSLVACSPPAPTTSPTPGPTQTVGPTSSPTPTPTQAKTTSPTPAQQVYKWKMQTVQVPGAMGFDLITDALDFMRKLTGGRMDVTPLGQGTLVDTDEMLEALGAGIFEASHQFPADAAGLDPGFPLLCTGPGLWKDANEFNLWKYEYGGNDLQAKIYAKYNVKFIGGQTYPPEPMFSNKPLRTLADFKGLKLRESLGPSSDTFIALGASPIDLPDGELYSAMQTHLIDAVCWAALKDCYDVGFAEVSKFLLMPSFQGPVTSNDFSVNMDKWNSLPDDLKTAWIATEAYFARNWYLKNQSAAAETLVLIKKQGLEVGVLPDADLLAINKIALGIFQKWGEQSPMATEIVNSIMAAQKAMGKL